MKLNTRQLLLAAFIVLMVPLLFIGNAGAKYMSDGATQNSSGGWDLPPDGFCAGHPELTSRPDCKTVTYPLYTTSSTCTATATGGANREWMWVCTASDGTPITLKGLDRTVAMCSAQGGTWGQGCVAKWVFGGNYPTPGNIDCLRCHNRNAQYSGYADENNKESYLKTGHKNTLRKLQQKNGPASSVNASGTPNYTFGYPWSGPDTAGNLQIYTTDGTNTVNFSDASVTIAGGPYAGQRNLYWIYGWISGLPSFFYGTDAYNGERTTFGTNNGYPCASCHSTGYQDDSNPGVAGIAPNPWTPAEPLASFPGLSPVSSANARWDQYGIQCSRCHYSTDPTELFFNLPTYPGEQPTSSGMGMLMLRDHAVRINLCFGCHQSTTGTGVSPTPGVAGGDPTLIPTGVNQGAVYGRDFNADVCGDAIGNSFLNSVHGQFNGATTTGVGTMMKNPVGTYDLFDPTPDIYYTAGGMATKAVYGSSFTSYDCWLMPGYGYHSYSTNADGTKIRTSAQCTTAGGSWVAEPEGTCSTCHDVHQSFMIAGDKPIKRECEDCHTAGGNQSDVGASTVDVSQMFHQMGNGTPFDTTKYGNSCVVCHMATQAVANRNQVSLDVHVWRINTDASYDTFPSMAQFYGGACDVHGGTLVSSNSFVTVYSSDTSSDNCATAGGTWMAVTQNRLATISPDTGEGYNNAVWVDLDLACGQCHGGTGGQTATVNNAPYFTKVQLSAAAKGIHTGSLDPDSCLTCHSTTQGTISAVVPGTNHHSGSCTTCHYAGAPDGRAPHDGVLSVITNALCLTCHSAAQGSYAAIVPGTNHHGSGTGAGSLCSDCHQEQMMPLPSTTDATCQGCHTEKLTMMAHAVNANTPGTCITCHKATGNYAGAKPTVLTGSTGVCGQCHQNAAKQSLGVLSLGSTYLQAKAVGIHTSSVISAGFNATVNSDNSLQADLDASFSACVAGSACTAPFTYAWDCGGGTSGGDNAVSSCTYADVGVYVITLTVTDSASHSARTAAEMTVTAPVIPPTAGVTGTPSCTNLQGSLQDNSTPGSTVTVTWGDGGITTQAAGTLFNHTYSKAATYELWQKAVNAGHQMSDPVQYSVTCAAGTSNITGTVKSYLGTLIKNALVTAKATALVGGVPKTVTYMAITDVNGNYTILNPAAPSSGAYTLTAMSSGYTFPNVTGVARGTSGLIIQATLPTTK